MAQGSIQVSGFPIESYQNILNRKYKHSLIKRTKQTVNRISRRSLYKQVSFNLCSQTTLRQSKSPDPSRLILPTSPREEYRRPTWAFRTSFSPYSLRLHERIWVRILALAIYRGATPKASYGTIS